MLISTATCYWELFLRAVLLAVSGAPRISHPATCLRLDICHVSFTENNKVNPGEFPGP